jgi:phage protein D
MAEEQMSGLRESRPDFFVGGEEKPDLAGGLTSLVIAEDTSGLYRCEAKFSNWGTKDTKTDFLYFDRQVLDFGKDFQVKLAGNVIFDGRVMALEATFPEGQAPEITVLAEDRFQDLRMTRRTRTFADVSDSDVFSQIASDHALSPSVDVQSPTYKVLAQVNQSDLAFMRERARSLDAELWMDGKTLNVKARSSRNGSTVEMTRGNQLREFRVVADLAMQRTSVKVSCWDVPGKQSQAQEATDSVITSEVGNDESGVSILKSKIGERKESLAHGVALNSDEAKSAAETFFKMSARRFVVGYGVAETKSDVRVGNYVDLKELGPLFSGKYYLTETKILFDSAKGIRTEFRGERAGISRGQ